MRKFMNKLLVLLLGSMVFGVNGFAYGPDAFVIKVYGKTYGIYTHYKVDNYNYSVDCNNDGINEITDHDGDYFCQYASAEMHTIVITGLFPAFQNYIHDYDLREIVQWGTGSWKTMAYAFRNANLSITASDIPNLSDVNSTEDMFEDSSLSTVDSSINNWDVSNVTNMENMFGDSNFNQYIGDWDVSNVTNMHSMFEGSNFNSAIGYWDVSNVTNMSEMFLNAGAFNKPINNWNVSNVTDMSNMFQIYNNDPSAFNQDIGDWNVTKVTNMSDMFNGANNFNQDIGDWNVSNVTGMSNMFSYASSFNQDIGDWDVSNISSMWGIFSRASAFNQDIGDWNVSNVNSMTNMFSHASAFNQDIGEWDVSNVDSMSSMFSHASAFNQDIGDWDVSNVESMHTMFENAHPISISNYDNLLYSWEKLNLRSNVNFHAGGDSYYCNQAFSKQIIMEDYSWTFTDGGYDCDFYIKTPNKVSVKSGETYVMNVSTNYVSDDPYDPGVHYYITGGTDRDKFTIDSLYGELNFIDAPNANNPTDRNGDSIYRVQVKADNAGYTTDYQTIKVKVESNSNGALAPVITYLLF